MDGVERIMVLGIFAVIVSILGVAAWSVTQEGGQEPALAADGGALVGSDLAAEAPLGRPGATRDAALAEQKAKLEALMGRKDAGGKGAANGADLASKVDRSGPRPPPPTGNAGPAATPTIDPGTLLRAQAQTEAPEPDATSGNTVMRSSILDLALNRSVQEPQFGAVPLTQAPPLPQKTVSTARQVQVREGDTVYKIARRELGEFNIAEAVKSIERLNPSLSIDSIYPGMTIVLPRSGNAPVTEASKAPAGPAGAPAAATSAAKTVAATDGQYRLYTVLDGETLSSIALSQLGKGGRWQEIYQINKARISNPDSVPAGLTLKLPLE